MKHILLIALSFVWFSCQTSQAAAGDTYEIRGKINGLSDTECYIAYHYGDKQYVKDTIPIDANSNLLFETDSLPGGIYMFVFPALENKYFEMILSGDEHSFSFETNTRDFINSMKIDGSKENQIFYDDMKFLAKMKVESDRINKQIELHKDDKEKKKALRNEIRDLDKEVKAHRAKLIKNHADLLYPKVLNAMSELEIPESPKDSDGNVIDSFFAYKYYKKHYWDRMDFSDGRLIRTPVYHNKLVQYMDKVVVQSPDSIIKACDVVLAKARKSPELFKYSLIYLLNRHAKSKIMGMDGVYVHLVDNYYSKGDAPWMSEHKLYQIEADAATLRPLILGKIAPNLRLQDLNNQWIELHQIESDYTLVYIWDPDCGHCKKSTPKLHELYKNELKAKGVEVYAVSTVNIEEKSKWTDFLDKHDMYDWINVGDLYYQTDFRDKYDVASTPVIFLLDHEFRIVGKKISVEQLGDFVDHLIKQKAMSAN